MGIHITEVNGQGHTLTLNVELIHWNGGEELFDYCRSVHIPSHALILVEPSQGSFTGTYADLKQELFDQAVE